MLAPDVRVDGGLTEIRRSAWFSAWPLLAMIVGFGPGLTAVGCSAPREAEPAVVEMGAAEGPTATVAAMNGEGAGPADAAGVPSTTSAEAQTMEGQSDESGSGAPPGGPGGTADEDSAAIEDIGNREATDAREESDASAEVETVTDGGGGVAPAAGVEVETAQPDANLESASRHPLSITAMRERIYPGSALVVQQELEPGPNYTRSLVSYRSEGYKIFALLTIPTDDPPPGGWPAVVFNHGYIPPAQYRTGERYRAYVDAFARAGYVVLMSDYRGHGNSEGPARGGYGSPDYTVDVLNGMTSLAGHPAVDRNRICMWGHSMGGNITLRAMVVRDDIRAGVIWAGVVVSYPDLLERWRRPTSFTSRIPSSGRRWRDELTETYGAPDENPGFWAEISANSFLADLSGPIQLHHGDADTSVPLEFSRILEAEIDAVGGRVELFEYPGDDHNISTSLSTALARSVEFFDRHVAGSGPGATTE